MDLRQALEAEVARFRAWADTFPVAERSGEWECLYDGWDGIYYAFHAFISATTCQEWDEELTQMLLYIIARDNEMEHLVKDLAQQPDNLVCLAKRAVSSSERDAKWQLAAELGHIGSRVPHAELVLLQFSRDRDMYVRRRTLTALADMGSLEVEHLVASVWETGDEYQRMAVLYALSKCGSPQLGPYLKRAEADGRQNLLGYVASIQAGNAG